MSNGAESPSDARAWAWLENLPRLDFMAVGRQRADGQVRVRLSPMHGQGQPLIHISAELPGLGKRVTGSGNDLSTAVHRLHSEAWSAGVRLPWPGIDYPQVAPSVVRTTVTDNSGWPVYDPHDPEQQREFTLAVERMMAPWQEE